MHISSRNFALAGAAMALAMTPAIAGAQDGTMPETAPQEAPASMPQTGPVTPPTATPATGTETDPAASPTESSTEATTEAPRTLTPEDQQAAMQAWPAATQEYYKALTAERQKMFWALTDTDKVRLSELPEPQRETAWAEIEAQFPPRG